MNQQHILGVELNRFLSQNKESIINTKIMKIIVENAVSIAFLSENMQTEKFIPHFRRKGLSSVVKDLN